VGVEQSLGLLVDLGSSCYPTAPERFVTFRLRTQDAIESVQTIVQFPVTSPTAGFLR
jgi:tRNA/tmRNA/rRNA uracil-C5-methylase (TrmA/RlmC/RlmD family)